MVPVLLVVWLRVDGPVPNLVRTASAFALLGAGLGIAIGVADDLLVRSRRLSLEGLRVGLVLGAVVGIVAGLAGQGLHLLIASPSGGATDLVVALESSSQMGARSLERVDPENHRQQAVAELMNHLDAKDRLAVVDFDAHPHRLQPLRRLASSKDLADARERVLSADSLGGVDLAPAVETAVALLELDQEVGRPRRVILVTSGAQRRGVEALDDVEVKGIPVHVVHLGRSSRQALQDLAQRSGGQYLAVSDPATLTTVLQGLYQTELAYARRSSILVPRLSGSLAQVASLITARTVAWTLLGMLMGLVHGARVRTREDLRRCTVAGGLAGVVGGVGLDPLGPLAFTGPAATLVASSTAVAGALACAIGFAANRGPDWKPLRWLWPSSDFDLRVLEVLARSLVWRSRAQELLSTAVGALIVAVPAVLVLKSLAILGTALEELAAEVRTYRLVDGLAEPIEALAAWIHPSLGIRHYLVLAGLVFLGAALGYWKAYLQTSSVRLQAQLALYQIENRPTSSTRSPPTAGAGTGPR